MGEEGGADSMRVCVCLHVCVCVCVSSVYAEGKVGQCLTASELLPLLLLLPLLCCVFHEKAQVLF